jgi:hypothetical protein
MKYVCWEGDTQVLELDGQGAGEGVVEKKECKDVRTITKKRWYNTGTYMYKEESTAGT